MIPIDQKTFTAFHREFSQLDDLYCKIKLNGTAFKVPYHPFWEKFAAGWEPDTARIYQKAISAGSTVLDIGAWIGPTLLFAYAAGAEKVIALEPNPGSYQQIQKLLQLNPHLAKIVSANNLAVADKEGVLSMGMRPGVSDTSTSGIMGDDFSVTTTTIRQLLKTRGLMLADLDLIKIDIEGAEALLIDDFHYLSQQPGTVLHLSIHIPFFPPTADKLALFNALKSFHIQDDRGYPLSSEALKERLLSCEPKPKWGTRHGNFFELLLKTP